MSMTTESEFGLGVMQVLASEPNHEATVRTLVKKVRNYVQLTDEDKKLSDTRDHEEIWEQRVRNLKSHDQTSGNVIHEGYVERVGHGLYRLTESGLLRLQNKGLI